MKKRAISDTAASVRQRLRNKSQEENRPFDEVVQYYAMERFLYRLSKSRHADRFTLKGALMLVVWRAPVTRPTVDIDLLGNMENSVETVVGAIRDICSQNVEEDGLAFDPGAARGEKIAEDADYEGVRVRFHGSLGKMRIPMQVDVGFGDAVVGLAVDVEYPTILDLPAPRLQGYSRESTIAEKFEVMTKLGLLNSRLKDFFDIWGLSRTWGFSGKTLSAAILTTFRSRGTVIAAPPTALTPEFAEDPRKAVQWQAFLNRGGLDNVPPDLGIVVEDIADFLMPVAAAIVEGRPFSKTWEPGGPWK